MTHHFKGSTQWTNPLCFIEFSKIYHLVKRNFTVTYCLQITALWEIQAPPPRFETCRHKCGPQASPELIMWPSYGLKLASSDLHHISFTALYWLSLHWSKHSTRHFTVSAIFSSCFNSPPPSGNINTKQTVKHPKYSLCDPSFITYIKFYMFRHPVAIIRESL
jgi:hypothetical protein